MGIIAWIIFGLIAGIIAKLIMPGRDGGGFFLTCIIQNIQFYNIIAPPIRICASSRTPTI